MSLLEILVVIIGGIIGGFILGFSVFFIYSKISDWNKKRKSKKMTKEEFKSPKIEITERSVKEENERELREFRQFRQFDKLRAFANKDNRGIERRDYDITDVFRESKRDSFPNKINNGFGTNEPNNTKNVGKIRFFE